MLLFFKSFGRLWSNTFKDLNRHFSITLSSIFSIAVALFIAMVMITTALNVDEIAAGIQEQFVIQVSLAPQVDQERISQIQYELLAFPEVSSAIYSSKQEELDSLISENGEMFSQYQGDRNPLYDVFLVKVKDLSDIDSLQKKISDIQGVIDIDYGGKLVLTLMKFFSSSRLIGALIAAAMAVLSYFLIQASVKMAIATRADEITIMRQVGAYNWYILIPFVWQGMIIGLAGAFIPSLILLFAYPLIYEGTGGNMVTSMFALIPPYPLILYECLGLLAAGLLIGTSASYFTARKYIKDTR